MAADLEIRRNDKSYLFQMLRAQSESIVPKEFNGLLAWAKSQMEPEDVKWVLREFEEWKNG